MIMIKGRESVISIFPLLLFLSRKEPFKYLISDLPFYVCFRSILKRVIDTVSKLGFLLFLNWVFYFVATWFN